MKSLLGQLLLALGVMVDQAAGRGELLAAEHTLVLPPRPLLSTGACGPAKEYDQ